MPKAARLGDMASGHGCFPPSPIIEASTDVFINRIPAARVGDAVQPHGCSKCSTHARTIATGSRSVFFNDQAAARIGDAVDCGGEIIEGSGNVLIGDDISVFAMAEQGDFRSLADNEVKQPGNEQWQQFAPADQQALLQQGLKPDAVMQAKENESEPLIVEPSAATQLPTRADEPYELVIATKNQSIEQYLAETYANPAAVREVFLLLNPHLKYNRVLPLQVVILPRQDLLACPLIPDEVTAYIQQMEGVLQQLYDPADRLLAYNHFDLLSTLDNVAQYGSAGAGIFASSLGAVNNNVKTVLQNIEAAYIRHLNNPKSFPKAEFFKYRQQQFATLKSPMGRLLMKQMGYDTDINIMRQLGLKEGKKKLLKGAQAGSLPHYAENLEKVSRQARLFKGVGHVSIALDAVHSGNEIYKACSVGREEECTKVKYTEGGRLSGSIAGGALGSYGGYFACNILFGVETAGTSLLWCGLVAGGIGGYAGSSTVSSAGEIGGNWLYRYLKDD